jgi:hypothetical protein
LPDAGVARRHDDHPRDVRLEDRGDRPRIAGHLRRAPVAAIEALREQLQRVGSRLDAARRPQSAVRDDRHLAEIAVDIECHCSHLVLLAVVDSGENRWANDIDGSALAAQPGKSQGRPLKPGLEAHRPKRPAQPAFSRTPLVPVART